MMKISNFKFLLILLLAICYLLYTIYITPAYAQDSSPSADLKQKLKELQTEIASKAAQLKLEISRKLQNRAYVGVIKSKSETSLTLAIKGSTKLVTINEYTEYSGKSSGKGKVSLKTLSLDDHIAALGDVDDNDVLTAKEVMRIIPQKPEEKQFLSGQVTSVKNQAITIQTTLGQSTSLSVDKDTVYQLGTDEGSLDDVTVGKTLIALAIREEDGPYTRFIYLYPGSDNLKTKLSTPSAESSPSAKATSSGQLKKSVLK
ncbi:MAG: DUF5666 domain-containing protein [bacterium]|nr:DUF5666 domain-containing protein [bacterium]